MKDSSTWKIIIADRGFVYVGRPAREGDQVVICDCHNIAQWRGNLGRLAKEGPGVDDIVQVFGVVSVHVLGVLSQIECNDEAWDAWADRQTDGNAKKRRQS